MRSTFRNLLVLATAAGAAASAPVASEEQPAPVAEARPSDLAEEVLVRRIRFPVRLIPRRPGGCDALEPSDVEVLENGAPRRVDAVDREGLDTLHAVLIDASYSMRDRLDRARRAARDYIEGLPGDEPVLLASFRDNLMLHTPPTTDRARLNRELERIEIGPYTAFNDALHSMVLYLAPRPERKVIVALTDGCDSASLHVHPFRRVVELAESAENMTVFPIGIDLPARCDGFFVSFGPSNGGPVDLLERLGRRSGGQLYRIEQAAALPEIFEQIRARLEQEGHVTYRPLELAAGAPPKVKIRIESWVPKDCRIEPAASTVRFAAEARRPTPEVPPLLAGDPTGLPWNERLELPYDELWRQRIPAEPTWLMLREDSIRGRVADVLVERGALYAARGYQAAGKYRVLPDLFERYEVRDVEIQVPPVEELRSTLDSIEGLLAWLVRRGAPPFEDPAEPGQKRVRLGGSWLHGQAFLELREVLGRVLYRYPDYRAWADGRLRAERREELERLVADYGKRHRLSASDARGLVRALEPAHPSPRPERLQRHLAEWLGDLTALDLVEALERSIAASLLGASQGAPGGGLVDVARAVWAEPDRWFPAPTRVRVITPMVPVYEASREAIGFYRVMLPSVTEGGPPPDRMPALPFGIGLAAWLERRLADTPAASNRVEVSAVRYEEIDRRQRRRVRRALEKPVPDLTDLRAVTLALHGGGDAPGLELTGYYIDPRRSRARLDERIPAEWTEATIVASRAPLCVATSVRGELPPGLAAVWRAVSERFPSCPPPERESDDPVVARGVPVH
jgi:Mg-chelatase subunit ChlD